MAPPRILVISPTDPDAAIIHEAATILASGGLVVAPTETRYGLLARADSRVALDHLYDVKGRPSSMPTSVFARGLAELSQFGFLTPLAKQLIAKFMPGPLTLVVRAKGTWEAQVVVNERIGLRWSTSPVIAKLLETTSFPITATSANRSGGPELDTAQQIAAELRESVDLYLDAGELKSVTSTVVDCSGGSISILRAGAIPVSEITGFIRDLEQE